MKPLGKKAAGDRAASRQEEKTWCDAHSHGSPAVGEVMVSRG